MPTNGERQEKLVENFDLPLISSERFFRVNIKLADPLISPFKLADPLISP